MSFEPGGHDTGSRVDPDSGVAQRQAQILAKPENDGIDEVTSKKTSVGPRVVNLIPSRLVRVRKNPAWQKD